MKCDFGAFEWAIGCFIEYKTGDRGRTCGHGGRLLRYYGSLVQIIAAAIAPRHFKDSMI